MTLGVGVVAAIYYALHGLTLSHYDAKAHLVVARRILDSLNPGWVQIGAVWLPLPHLLNMLPVQIDAFYRTGASGVAISIIAMAATVATLARIVIWATGSRLAALLGVLVVASNPNLLYLQSTPMTESLLLALTTASVWLTIRYLADPPPPRLRRGLAEVRRTKADDPSACRLRAAGLVIAGACLTRYEAWPVTGALLTLGVAALRHRGTAWRDAVLRMARLAAYPLAALLGFLLLSRASTGAWFVTAGFFVPENIATARPLKSVLSVWWGGHALTSYTLASVALAGFAIATWTAIRDRKQSALVLAVSLAAAGALPAYAFFSGHPFRIRYMVPLVPAIGLGVGLFAGLVRWRLAGILVATGALLTAPLPFDPTAPMVVEAQWDAPNRVDRQTVTAYLRQHWDHELVMASMGSLAHYMQELSDAGFALRDFLHEGNGVIWDAALVNPGAHVEWLLIEERAEGGDMIAQRARSRPRYLDGFVRVAEGGGVALYRHVRTGT